MEPNEKVKSWIYKHKLIGDRTEYIVDGDTLIGVNKPKRMSDTLEFPPVRKIDIKEQHHELYTIIKKLIIPDTVEEICDSMTSKIGGKFIMEEVVIPKSVKKIGRLAFENLTTTDFVFDGTLPELGTGALNNTGFLIKNKKTNRGLIDGKKLIFADDQVNTEYYVNDIVTELNDGCFYKSELDTIVINDKIKTIPQDCCYGCYNLQRITIGKNVEYIGMAAFANCTRLEGVRIPPSVKIIESFAFSHCGLEIIDIQEGVEYIGSGAFECTELSSIKLPKSLKYIAADAFDDCFELMTIEMSRDTKIIDIDERTKEIALENYFSNDDYKKCTVEEILKNGKIVNKFSVEEDSLLTILHYD